jgi:serine/threonine protein kinase
MEMGHLNPASLPSGTRIGAWRLLEQRGRGAYGVVYRAEAVEAGQGAVALKLALYPADTRFAREAELLSRIRHPCVPRLLDHGQWLSGTSAAYAWLAMEWVEGLPLYDWAQAQRPSSRQVLQLLGGLAGALEATHSAGGVHRDVKGDNIRVRRVDGRPFLLDFGSGHYLGASTLTWEPFPPGTSAYRSPEAWRFVLRSRKPPAFAYAPGPADDLFALGVTAYRLVTGKYPPSPHLRHDDAWLWQPETLALWAARVINGRCAPELSDLVTRMLSPDSKARGSARELAEALEQAALRAGPEADVPLFTGEEPQPAGLFPPLQRVTVQRPPRVSRWPRVVALGLSTSVAVGTVVLLNTWPVEVPETPHLAQEEEAEDAGTVAVGDSALTAPVALEQAPAMWPAIGVELPPKPFPGQRRPDAQGRCPGKVQVAINGGCWRKVEATDKKDCDNDTYSYRGACYVPLYPPPRPATSGPTTQSDGGEYCRRCAT